LPENPASRQTESRLGGVRMVRRPLMGESSENWRSLLEPQAGALALFARQFLSCAHDAEDAVQDGFVRFWRSRGRVRESRAYLYACVRTAALDLSRGQRRRRQREQAVARPDDETCLDVGTESLLWRDAVQAALQTLPVEQREVLVLKIWSGLTFVEIAQLQGVAIDTAASRYRYALGALRKSLNAEDRA
jgi:RNA polymerase sigma-70 factor, ECF subfamily